MRANVKALLAVAAVVGGFFFVPPIPQPPGYHAFADGRVVLGIDNGLNVLSNLPFALVGLWGLVVLARDGRERPSAFHDPWVRWPYAAVFLGTALATVGSSYYHLEPDNARLVWDRMPITLGLIGLLVAVVAERESVKLAQRLFLPCLFGGAGGLAYWYWTERQGAGDLRPYMLVYAASLASVAWLIWKRPAPDTGPGRETPYMVAALVAYVGALGLELADHQVFAAGQIVSGHALKHVVAALAVACLVAMLDARVRREPAPSGLPGRYDV